MGSQRTACAHQPFLSPREAARPAVVEGSLAVRFCMAASGRAAEIVRLCKVKSTPMKCVKCFAREAEMRWQAYEMREMRRELKIYILY